VLQEGMLTKSGAIYFGGFVTPIRRNQRVKSPFYPVNDGKGDGPNIGSGKWRRAVESKLVKR